MAGVCSTDVQIRHAYTILAGNLDKWLARIILKSIMKVTRYEGVGWIHLIQDRALL
jgi:hypothetical protein